MWLPSWWTASCFPFKKIKPITFFPNLKSLDPRQNNAALSIALWSSVRWPDSKMFALTGRRADWSVWSERFSVGGISQASLPLPDKAATGAAAGDSRLWCGLKETAGAARVWEVITRCVWIWGRLGTDSESAAVCHYGSRTINQRTSLCILLSKTPSQSTSHDSQRLISIQVKDGDGSALSYLTPILCLFHVYDHLDELQERSEAENTTNNSCRQEKYDKCLMKLLM